MYLKHCKLTTKDKKYADEKAIEYTKRFGIRFLVIKKDWLGHFIVFEEQYSKYFEDKRDKGLIIKEQENQRKGQLILNFFTS